LALSEYGKSSFAKKIEIEASIYGEMKEENSFGGKDLGLSDL
jgi:hypothetical protein